MIWALAAAVAIWWFWWRPGRWRRMEGHMEREMEREKRESLRRDRRR